MKNLVYLIVLTASVVVLNSCVSARVIRLDEGKTYPAIPVEEVVIFLSPEDIPAQYEKVAIISTDYVSSYDEAKWNKVRKKCAALGCNGVFTSYESRAGVLERIVSYASSHIPSNKAEFIAVRYNKK